MLPMPFGFEIIKGPPNPVPEKNETPEQELEREQRTARIDNARNCISSYYFNIIHPAISAPEMGPEDTFF